MARRIRGNTPLTIALIIATMSCATIYSARTIGGDSLAPFVKQICWTVAGIVAFIVVTRFNYLRYANAAYLIYAVSLGLVAVCFVLPAVKGVHRWIPLGPVSIQPAEFMKIALIVVLARYLMFRDSYRQLTGLVSPFLLTMVPIVLIARQPDLGTAMVLLPILFGLLFMAGARVRDLATVVGIGIGCMPLLWFFVLKPYQKDRILAFLFPNKSEYALKEAYHLIQSKIAIGAGQVFGRGFLHGTQPRFLPESHTDFAFASFAEEWGLVGVAILMTLYFLIIAWGVRVAGRTQEPFGRLICMGVVFLFSFQVIVNTGMTVGLMPITGLPLPLFSYGGSSMLASFIALGLMANVGRRRVWTVAADDFA